MKQRAARLKQARIAAGYPTVRSAVEAMGVTYSTYAGHENGSREYGIDDAKRYARMFRVRWEWLMDGSSASQRTNELAPVKMGLATIPIVGTVQAGVWTEAEEGEAIDVRHYVHPDARHPASAQVAYRVEGNSLNETAKPGSILICLDIIKGGVVIEDNDLVIVERTRFAGQMLERTAKRARKVTTGWELWPESNDPAHQEPIRVDEGHESDEVRIAAKVLWIMHQP